MVSVDQRLEDMKLELALLGQSMEMQNRALVEGMGKLQGTLDRVVVVLVVAVLAELGKLIEVVLQLTKPHVGG